MTLTVFCCICKRHVAVADLDEFKACGHDDRKVAKLDRGLVGVRAHPRDSSEQLDVVVATEIAEAFENETRIAA